MNAQRQLLKLIEELKATAKKPRLLLHCCCAPCASAAFDCLLGSFETTPYFFNPNITNEEEYRKRFSELKRFSSIFGLNAIDGCYMPELFNEAATGLEQEPERGKRCEACYTLRLSAAAEAAGDFDYFATTLTLSPLKDADKINAIGLSLSPKYLPSDFKKNDGYKKSIELSKK
ncbi:MAG TPA: epoxyqueuosine reductase QueH [Eubacteriales bacterium]|nr:epoxyqueuosine reductase QueH [Eubacteriales bacterium]